MLVIHTSYVGLRVVEGSTWPLVVRAEMLLVVEIMVVRDSRKESSNWAKLIRRIVIFVIVCA